MNLALMFLLAILQPATLENQYPATVIEVIDGDTVRIDIDLGLGIHKIETVRLTGINAPEKNTDAGKASKLFVAKLISGKEIIIVTHSDKREKYGRLLAIIYLDNSNINELLIQKGLAVSYDGGKRTP